MSRNSASKSVNVYCPEKLYDGNQFIQPLAIVKNNARHGKKTTSPCQNVSMDIYPFRIRVLLASAETVIRLTLLWVAVFVFRYSFCTTRSTLKQRYSSDAISVDICLVL
jgi:hypothetical protein